MAVGRVYHNNGKSESSFSNSIPSFFACLLAFFPSFFLSVIHSFVHCGYRNCNMLRCCSPNCSHVRSFVRPAATWRRFNDWGEILPPLSVCLSVCLSAFLSFCVRVCTFQWLWRDPSSLYVCLPVCLSFLPFHCTLQCKFHCTRGSNCWWLSTGWQRVKVKHIC